MTDPQRSFVDSLHSHLRWYGYFLMVWHHQPVIFIETKGIVITFLINNTRVWMACVNWFHHSWELDERWLMNIFIVAVA